MMKVPEKIYLLTEACEQYENKLRYGHQTEYTRTKTIPALLAAERERALREVATELEVNWGHKATPEMRDAILALIDSKAPDTIDPRAQLPLKTFEGATPETSNVVLCDYCGDSLHDPEHGIRWENSQRHECMPMLSEALTTVLDENYRLKSLLGEMVDLMEGVRSGDYVPDSFTCQPARAALKGSVK